jgi:hypothetical protein
MLTRGGFSSSLTLPGVQQLPGQEAEVRRAKAVLVVQRREPELRVSRHSASKVSLASVRRPSLTIVGLISMLRIF